MNTSELKQKVHEIIEASDEEVLKTVYTLLQASDAQYILGASIDEYNAELEKAETDIDKGNFTTQEDLENEIKKW
jgi:predicted transcriptional regulator